MDLHYAMLPRELCEASTARDARAHEPKALCSVYTCKFIVTPFGDRKCYDNLVCI
jgi:hypothetical protein